MLYIFSVLPTPEKFIKRLNTIIYNFLWNGPDKIARLAVINDVKDGGLNLTDLETSIKSLRLAWIGRLFMTTSQRFKCVPQILRLLSIHIFKLLFKVIAYSFRSICRQAGMLPKIVKSATPLM